MDGTLFRRTLLAAAFGFGVCAGLARADGPMATGPVPPQAPAVLVINGMVYTNTGIAAAAPAAPVATVPVVATVPAGPTDPVAPAAAPCAACAANAAAAADGSTGKKHWFNFWHKNNEQGEHKQIGCWTHFNNYTCGTWESEAGFLFGSCRNFFGEPCMGKPEPAFPGEQPPRNICPNCARP